MGGRALATLPSMSDYMGRMWRRQWSPTHLCCVTPELVRTSRRCCGLASHRSLTSVIQFRWPTTASRHGQPAWSCDGWKYPSVVRHQRENSTLKRPTLWAPLPFCLSDLAMCRCVEFRCKRGEHRMLFMFLWWMGAIIDRGPDGCHL